MDAESFDYIIVGAGSAGCVLANRLSENPSKTVLLIEAGGWDKNPWIHIPIGYFKTMHNSSTDWCYTTENDPGIGGRRLQWPRGKVVGGSSSLNGLLYVRGQKQDYDNWAALGNKGWSYDEVLPYFIKSEDQENGASTFHGVGGPLKVSNLRVKRPIADAFLNAAVQFGIPFNEDFNGSNQEGAGYFQQTAYKGLRWSSSKAFLKPVLKRKNLVVRTRCRVNKLLLKGCKAVGLNYQNGSKAIDVFCKSEVILSAGAIGSPQILQLSGVGPKKVLNKFGISPVVELDGVGKNLQDHLQIRLIYKTFEKTLNDELNSFFKKLYVGFQYLVTRSGPLSLAASQVAIFTKSSEYEDRPDIQFHMQPLSADKPGDGVHPFSAFTSSVCQLRPRSRGYVEIVSRDPSVYPLIQPNYLSHEEDRSVAVKAIKIARSICAQSAISSKILKEFVPGDKYKSDEDLIAAAMRYSQTIYHPVGTCKMGQDELSVVDERLKVRGIEGLRVVDASIMPLITSGNTNAPTIMIAEKASDMIIEDS